MQVTDEMAGRLGERLVLQHGFTAIQASDVLRVVMELLADVPEPLDADPVCALIDVQTERIAELEAKLAMVRDAWERYWRTDGTGIDREEYDEIITGIVEVP